MAELETRNLSASYDGQSVFSDFSLSFDKGSLTAIAGPNGAGKSTFLKHLIKEIKTDDNTVFFGEDDINSLKQKDIAKRISFVGQSSLRTSEFTVLETVAMGRYCHGDQISNLEKAKQAIRMCAIEHIENKLITRISGGEFQLVMLARAICQDTRIIALDEPVNNLDPLHQKLLMELLCRLAEEGRTIICVLHDLNAILAYCSRCVLVKDGRICSQGPTDEVLTKENILETYGIECTFIEGGGRRFIAF